MRIFALLLSLCSFVAFAHPSLAQNWNQQFQQNMAQGGGIETQRLIMQMRQQQEQFNEQQALARQVAQLQQAQVQDDQIRQILILQSLRNYQGNCPCPYNVDRAGRSCG